MQKYKHEPNGGLVPHKDGRWVRADTAQEMYDMLLYVLSETDHNPILEADIQEVLTKVNKGDF